MEIILTGCDDKTAWQVPFFVKSIRTHNPSAELILADFGLSEENLEKFSHLFDGVFYVDSDAKGWFKKPLAILEASQIVGVTKVCWLDTDCQVTADISDIFKLSTPQTLGMVEDRPWTARRPQLGKWYNSGCVLVEGAPQILKLWAKQCVTNPTQGDQEVLHMMMDGDEIKKIRFINPLPHTYNTLRLDYIDNIAVKNPKVIHHTGDKGNAVLSELMKQSNEEK
jgi:hypothetical protein|tara:strand:+ start:8733 stop:9404 length:672 start_codon:yes stop_codon:yes gene_type:complete